MFDEAVILASGLGTRLKSISSVPKFAFELLGKPLIHYPMLSLKRAGVTKFYVVVAKGYAGLARKLLGGFNAVILENDQPERENGYTLFYAKHVITSTEFYVSVCDHIYPAEMALKLKQAYLGEDILIAGDSSPRYVELVEATKIRIDGRVKVSKGLGSYDYIDTGLFIFSSNIFSMDFEREERLSLNRLITLSSERGLRVGVADVTGLPWKDVDTPEDVRYIIEGEGREVIEAWRAYHDQED